MPLHDFQCQQCQHCFEELHKQDELVCCPVCQQPALQLVSPLADYTGLASQTVNYVTRNSTVRDSHLGKAPKDPIFLSKQAYNADTSGKVLR